MTGQQLPTKIGLRMKAITNTDLLEKGDMILFYGDERNQWQKAIIIEKDNYLIDIIAIEGVLKGFTWTVLPGELLEPDYYMILDND